MDLPQLGLLECCSSQSSPPQCVLLNVVFLRVFLLRSDLYGQVLSVSAWLSSVRSDLPHVDRSRRGWLPQRGRLPRRAPLCFSAGSLQSFSQGFFPQRVSFPPHGSTWSAFLLSSVLNASFSSAWFSLAWFSPSAPTAFFHSVCCFVVLQAVFSAWHKGQVCMAAPVAPHAASTRGRKPRQIHAALSRLHLRFVASASSSFSV